ncbi:MAG: copper amine oxidase N-terminal domain-containing protein [Syntrophomonas sp.]
MKTCQRMVVLIILLLFTVNPVSALEYGTTREALVEPGVVGEIGGLVAHYDRGQLRQEDQILMRLPEDFFWTRADLGANDATALANIQTSADWAGVNLIAADQMRYGCAENNIMVPASYGSEVNGLFNGPAALLKVELLNSRELLISFTGTPDSTKECFFILNSNRVFVPSGFEGDISVQIESPSNYALQWPKEDEKPSGEVSTNQPPNDIKQTTGASSNPASDAGKALKLQIWVDKGEAQINGEPIPVLCYIYNDRAYISLRFLAEKLGAKNIQWLPDSGEILIQQDEHLLKFAVGQNHIIIDGQPTYSMEGPVQINESGSAMAPLGYLAQALGAEVNWDQSQRMVTISK